MSYSINDFYYDICKFHDAADEPMPVMPTMLPVDNEAKNASFLADNLSKALKIYTSSDNDNLMLKRVSWMLEEIAELLRAETIEDQVDALTDLMVFTVGTFTYMGLEPEQFPRVVMAANMGKIGENGKVLRNAQGKIVKPDDWKEKYAPEPLIATEIERQRKAAEECPF
ncbi:hypothetical protein [Paenibacillus camelliae]|uniref:hypothetical protein n=1 Tax=Paenibacillus camelliae TaxID=512410 RepID=UPI00203E232C|nr:hypothetical protein [Paenibacillus camelliae]MCM3632876.1 hypothetical protein [Paenibacillus camelliae]